MISAKDLRIGNLVDGIRGIERVNIDLLQEIENYPDKFKPIPLTEEWLFKFGHDFKIKDARVCEITKLDYCLGEMYLATYKTGVIQLIRKTELSQNFNTIITYVHQLQNLFYCLCGEELTIKE